jgi:hypothetical protein
MSRMNGERPEAYAARKVFEYERKHAAPLDLKPESVSWPRPCLCARYPFAHYHVETTPVQDREGRGNV